MPVSILIFSRGRRPFWTSVFLPPAQADASHDSRFEILTTLSHLIIEIQSCATTFASIISSIKYSVIHLMKDSTSDWLLLPAPLPAIGLAAPYQMSGL